ncbi:MAG: SusC/RagA family TonB-linked outer membrane protein, partial [Muribaculaceae bacterium]|nr:SusC/RagA family TonB-linked outer membrane protein [Muribaculaceae bacterium]
LYNGHWITPDDWTEETYRTGLRQEYNLSISGGTDRFNFYGSVGYLNDEGIIEGSSYARLSSRVGAEYQAKKWLKVGTSIAYNYVKMNSPTNQDAESEGSSGNAFFMTNNIAPIYPIYVRDAHGNILTDAKSGHKVYDYGDGTYTGGATRNFMMSANPAGTLIYDTNTLLMDVLDAKWYATVTPIENLNVTGTIGYFLDNTRRHQIGNPFYGSLTQLGGSAMQYQSRLRGLNLQVLANYRKTFADIHHTDYMVGYESYERTSEVVYARGYNLYNPNSWAVNNTLDSESRKGYGSSSGYATRGIFGRVNYDYDSRYFASVSFRRDASSNFHPDHRWGNFFSFSLAWDAAKESFLKEQTWIDMLKVKGSYGQQGNDNLYPGLEYAPYYLSLIHL